MSESKVFTRRSFFQFAVAGAVIIPGLLKAADKCPAAPPTGKMIADPTTGMGKTLQYVTDAKASKNAKFKTGSHCGNCKFFNTGKTEGGYAPCTMMGMKYVSECGWCMSYALKT